MKNYHSLFFIFFALTIGCNVDSQNDEILLRLNRIEEKLNSTDNNSTIKKEEIAETAKTLTEEELEAYIEQIEQGHMPNEKLKIAKNLCRNISLESKQVRDIVSVLFGPPTKKSFAKFAYKRTIDKQNFHLVVELFHFMDRGELQDFIEQEN